VLAGIALKVGINIIDWGFLKRAHLISGKGALITYGVITLTVFVDLIVAVGIGLFVANVMTITRLSELQADDVKAVTDPDETDLELTAYERDLLKMAQGKLMLLNLKGTMIFGASRAISRKNSAVEDCQTLIIDITDLVHLGVSSALVLEEAILDMLKAGRSVYVVGAKGQPLKRLEKIGVLQQLPQKNLIKKRAVALEQAIYSTTSHEDHAELGDLPITNSDE
jgi:SulP family sulfate permease